MSVQCLIHSLHYFPLVICSLIHSIVHPSFFTLVTPYFAEYHSFFLLNVLNVLFKRFPSYDAGQLIFIQFI